MCWVGGFSVLLYGLITIYNITNHLAIYSLINLKGFYRLFLHRKWITCPIAKYRRHINRFSFCRSKWNFSDWTGILLQHRCYQQEKKSKNPYLLLMDIRERQNSWLKNFRLSYAPCRGLRDLLEIVMLISRDLIGLFLPVDDKLKWLPCLL